MFPGLFTYPGAPAIPASGLISAGLAGTITVAASVDQTVGGNPNLLRDGAISGNAAYTYNTGGEAGFFDALQQLVDDIAAKPAVRSVGAGEAECQPDRFCRIVGQLAGIPAQERRRRIDL